VVRNYLIGILLVVFVMCFLAQLGGWTGWLWEACRISACILAVVVVASWSRGAAVIAVAAWAVLACPLPVRPHPRPVRGGLLAKPLRRDAYTAWVGDIPTSAVWFRTTDKQYFVGESGLARWDLIGWSISWLPWPHIDRTQTSALGGSADRWGPAGELETLNELDKPHQLVIADADKPELGARSLSLGVSQSPVSWLGWIAIAVALAYRRWSDPHPVTSRAKSSKASR
jgi:hypothetical protein